MTASVEDFPEARAEYPEAVAYYDGLRPGLGDELVARFEEGIREIVGDPDAWPRVPDWIDEPDLRSHRVPAFRYRIVYHVAGATIRIVAYSHTSRRPTHWGGRLGDRTS